ncbi:hypothetical protein [Streptomyces cavernicola]|uniref:Uncharacterized protein n=1 Tax=Streptomyces cavernicola TaxID=3043613 RepID=A0ABT6SDN7_9ACTN|nr:hypothetical protein [Streptomyces sp. B-S-A6]MDI3405401.1 hypothetical protein [Streptomyces sp. B-S-A6]
MDPTMFFTAQLQVTWRRHSESLTPANLTVAPRLVRSAVEEAAGHCDILRPDAAEQDITAALQARIPLSGDGVVVTAVRARITVDSETREAALRAERLCQENRQREERLRHEYELDELARRQARARAAFLREEILANPATARLYTLLEGGTENWARLGDIPENTELSGLVREIQEWQPEQRWVTVAQLLHKFVNGLTLEGRKELLTILADIVRSFGDEGTAGQLLAVVSDAR